MYILISKLVIRYIFSLLVNPKNGDKMNNKKKYLNDYFDLFNMEYSKEKEYMKTDIYEKANHYIIEVDLPGIKKENIKINYENGYLSIRISRSFITANNIYIRRERFFGELMRSFYIGIKRESDIKAIYKDAILLISFPKEDIKKNNVKDISIS